ncbi:MAG TPA: oxidoreductase, partial [Balneolaceae bacterium]|nr:oxidoreductase [Balneolaceae bacterium]
RMVAYTSVNHMGYLIFGVAIAAVTTTTSGMIALDGAVLQMISHGVVTGVLFLLVGALQDRTGTREMNEMTGLLKTYPILSGLFMLAAFASLGLPGLAHFPAEFQIFLGGFDVYPVAVGIIIIGLPITTALYLRAIQKVFLGTLPEGFTGLKDLGSRELWAIVPLILATILIGVYPDSLLSMIHATTNFFGL